MRAWAAGAFVVLRGSGNTAALAFARHTSSCMHGVWSHPQCRVLRLSEGEVSPSKEKLRRSNSSGAQSAQLAAKARECAQLAETVANRDRELKRLRQTMETKDKVGSPSVPATRRRLPRSRSRVLASGIEARMPPVRVTCLMATRLSLPIGAGARSSASSVPAGFGRSSDARLCQREGATLLRPHPPTRAHKRVSPSP